MQLSSLPKIFLGANSMNGFINKFDDFYKDDNYYAYIIKGGPGTGKSTVMKAVAQYFSSFGENVILSPCSSDPDSLDAVILNDRKIIVLDGTSPHSVECKLIGVCDEILDFSAFLNKERLKPDREKIITEFNNNKNLHSKASKNIASAGKVLLENEKVVLGAVSLEKAVKFAQKFADKFFVWKNNQGIEKVCFLSGVTPKGIIFFKNTINEFASQRIIIRDEFGAVSGTVLSFIRDMAILYGENIITVYNSVLGEKRIDHIIFPDLSLAICTENFYMKTGGDERRINFESFCDKNYLKHYNLRLNINLQIAKDFLLTAAENLQLAKMSHDTLERFYINAMDFNGLSDFGENLINRIETKKEM